MKNATRMTNKLDGNLLVRTNKKECLKSAIFRMTREFKGHGVCSTTRIITNEYASFYDFMLQWEVGHS